MHIRKIFGNLLLLTFLFFTYGAFVFTLTKYPIIPLNRVSIFFYGMMAPFQGYDYRNAELMADGKTLDGAWVPIDLRAYYPLSNGEYIYRGYMQTSRNRSEEILTQHYNQLRILLLEKEREQGREYADIQLYFDVWPKSPMGFAALKKEPFVERATLFEL